MRKRLCAVSCAALALLMPAMPALAQENATPETAYVAEHSLPDVLSEEERGYTHLGLYETPPAELDDGELAMDTFALQSYNTANADTVYRFLVSECGMSTAQAAGVMGSIYTESRFDPVAYNPRDVDGESYGLCQWHDVAGSGRYQMLRDWCGANGYDYTTLDGQLHYIKHEIFDTAENKIWTSTGTSGLCFGTVENTREGAWTAGYTWARTYERGWNGYWNSRGDYAQEFFDAYAGTVVPSTPAAPSVTPGQAADSTYAAAFATRLYTVCLDRKPDAAGLAYWTNLLQTGQKTGIQTAADFVFSDEFKAKNYCNTDFVKQLYRAFMGREFDANGLAYWVNQLKTGAMREAVFNGFATSAEFANVCKNYGITYGTAIPLPATGTVAAGTCAACGEADDITKFVTRLYNTCLDRGPEPAGLRDWVTKLATQTESGRTVAHGFVFSNEFVAKNYDNDQYLEHLYKAFMGRGSDAAGKAYWLNQIAAGADREAVFNGFVVSDEFTKICQSYGITRG